MTLKTEHFDPIMIVKRDGGKQKLNSKKIINAIKKAMAETEKGVDSDLINIITNEVVDILSDTFDEYTVEQIQDLIEQKLMLSERCDVAKTYILFREKRAIDRDREWNMTEFERGIWENRYRHDNESFNQWLDRVSGGNTKIRKRIKNKQFLFGGRILASRGLLNDSFKSTLSNCYVLEPPQDNIEGIFRTASEMARTYSYGGGVGISLRNLRPKGSKVKNSAKETSGAVSFMELYDLTTKIIGQAGRRGALMISIPSTHPDLEEFIDIKTDLDKITKANISIEIDDEFMVAVKNKTMYTLSFLVKDSGELIEKEINAYNLFYKICKNNWNMAEPGLLFWDRIKSHHLMSEDKTFIYAGVNPCAEEPLPAGNSCLLGAINLSEFVASKFTNKAYFDFDKFSDCVHDSIEALNEVLEEGIKFHPLELQKVKAKQLRQIGLGLMGLADTFIKLGLVYGEENSIELSKKIAKTLLNESVKKSALIANEKGTFETFNYKNTSKSKFYQDNITPEVKELVRKYGLRNSQLLTCAPTGSTSTMLGTSGGIEPVYAWSYTRGSHNKDVGEFSYKIYTNIAKEYMEKFNIANESDLPEFFICSQELNYRKRIDMQSIWQTYIDASISSTINLPEEATIEDIMIIYLYAWKMGLKGVTIYRDNCSRIGVLTVDKKDKETEKETCPECGEKAMIKTNGCSECQNCGYSPCSI